MNASAGNSGPDAGTVDNVGPWVTTVGASTLDKTYTSTLTLTAADGASYRKAGKTLTQGVEPSPVVLASAVSGYEGGAECTAPFAAGTLTGKVVACARDVNNRTDKSWNALQGGAAGMILYNSVASDTEADSHFVRAIHLDGPNDDLVSFLKAHPDATATWDAGKLLKATGDTMAGFSSRGPNGDFLKPDVTTPGVDILAGVPTSQGDPSSGPSGEQYAVWSGTSMSAPHATGVSVLVKAAHPSWTPGQIKSALMTSSVQSVVNPDGSAAGVFQRGAGSIRANRALSPTLTISETAAKFATGLTDRLSRINLNLPSVSVDPLPGAAVVKRTVMNVTSSWQSFSVTAKGQTASPSGCPRRGSRSPRERAAN